MKLNKGVIAISIVFALYGLWIFVRKIMNRNNTEGKFKGMKYFAEPYALANRKLSSSSPYVKYGNPSVNSIQEYYSTTGCTCNKKGFFGGCKSGDCCSVPKEKLLSGTALTDKERDALVYCPGYLDACKEHIKSLTGQVPANVVTACMNPSTIAEVVKKIF